MVFPFAYCKLRLLMRRPTRRTLALLPILFFACFTFAGYAQTIKHSYRFLNNLSVAAPECGPDLIGVREATGGCTFNPVPGLFVSQTIPHCGIKRIVYQNSLNWGLRYPNTDGTIGTTYTIHIYVRTTDWGTRNYSRILDFSNGASDNGIYFHKNTGANRCLSFYPNGDIGACPYFNTSEYYLLTFTRNGATNIIDVYVNNTLFTSYLDTNNDYIGTAGTPIYIYRDDRVVDCESGSGYFAYLSFTNQYIDQATVNQVYNDICTIANVNEAADFTMSATSSCDPAQPFTFNYTGDIVPPGNGYTFTWDWDGGTVVSGTGMGPYNVKWTTAGSKNITLKIKNNSCNSENDTTKKFQINLPKDTSITKSICQGQTFEGYSTTGIYTDTYTGKNGCDSVRTLNLTVVSSITTTIDTLLCNGGSYEGYTTAGTFTDNFISAAGCDSIRTVNITIGSGGTTVIDTAICQGQSYEGYTASGSYTNTYPSVTGCDSTVTINLTVNQPKLETVNVNLCPGSSYTLPNGDVVNTTGLHNLSFTAKDGCDSTVYYNVVLYDEYTVTATTQSASCYGIEDGSISLVTSGNTAPYTFSLPGKPDNNSGDFDNVSPGVHHYTVTDANNCPVYGFTEVNSPAKITINVHPVDTTVNAGSVVNIISWVNEPNAVYQWKPPAYLSCTNCPNPIAIPAQDVRYTLTVISLNNGAQCVADTAIRIRVTAPKPMFPTAFSPNGDGFNDIFKLLDYQLNEIEGISIVIYNRWGVKIFEGVTKDFKWDGTFDNKPQPIGVYTYIIKYKLVSRNSYEPILKGNITLLR